MTDLEFKVKILKEMNDHVIGIGDEDIIEYWLTYGIPDDADEDEYKEFAKDWDTWTDILRAFNRCLKMNNEV